MAGPESQLVRHPQRAQLDADLESGVVTYSELARRYGVTRPAVQRYANRRLILTMESEFEAADGDPSSLIGRLTMLADDLRSARHRMLQSGHLSAHTAAGRAEHAVLTTLVDQLQIDGDLSAYFSQGRAVARVLSRLIKRSPELTEWLIEQFEELADTDMAEAIRNEARKIEKEVTS